MNKYRNKTYALKKILFIALYIFLISVAINSNINTQKVNQEEIKRIYKDANLSFELTKGNYPGYNNFQLNYENECSKYFKYHKNSKRDIVIFAYTFRPEKNFFSVFDYIIDSFKHSVPKAKIATIIPQKDINSEGAKKLKKYGIKLIPFMDYENYNIVTSRYIAIYDFLKNNTNKYKRIFLSDIDDVYMFKDIFSTFKEDEIIINKQCFKFESEYCNLLFPIDEKWFNDNYIYNSNNTIKDLNLIEDIGKDKINPQVINGGIIFGGTKKILDFLQIFNEYINPNKARNFGYDQVLITLLVCKKKFESIGLKLERCTQRICFMPNIKYNLNTTKIIYKQSMCSPIILHKSIPNSWKSGI